MSEGIHDRARRLMADRAIGILKEDEARDLETHLAECPDCADAASALNLGVQVIRSVPVRVDVELVQATRRSVRLYAERLRENDVRMKMMIVSCALAAAVGAFSLPYFFRVATWLGGLLSFPQFVLYAGMAVFWLVPGLVVAIAILARRLQADLNGNIEVL